MNRHPSITPLPDALQDYFNTLPDEDRAALEEAWALAEAGRPEVEFDPGRKADLWAALERAASAPPPVIPRRRPWAVSLLPPRPVYPWLALAAAVALLVTVGLFLRRPPNIQVPYGETLSAVELPDGSHVDLNSGTELKVAFDRDTRVVLLEGEAFFDVVPDGRPFVVETFNARTRVLGTSFNVRAWQTDPIPNTRVMVATGRVRVAALGDTTQVAYLSPNQATEVTDGVATPDSISLRVALAWRNGGLVFINSQPIGAIFDELERRFNMKIVASPQIRGRQYHYSKFTPVDIDGVLGDLTQAADLRFRATANGYEVYEP